MEKKVNPPLPSGILNEKNRAVKTVSKHDGGTTMTDSVVEQRLLNNVIFICRRRGSHRNKQGEKCYIDEI